MSKCETPMTRKYWEDVGGILIEEFPAVRASAKAGPRHMDGVIVLGPEKRIAKWWEVDLEGQDIIVVQAKARRLGMALMGQALFSAELMKDFKPKSIRSVMLCTRDDEVMRRLLVSYPFIEVVVMPECALRRQRLASRLAAEEAL
jgi:hypothetical protein